MITLQIALPEEMVIFIEAQTAARRLGGPGEYLQALIAQAQKEQQDVELESRFAEAIRAIERGEANPLSPEDWQSLQQRVLNRQRQ